MMTTTHDATDRETVAARDGRNRVRTVAYWATTVVILVELASGSIWNLMPIDWTTAQLNHLGYPSFFAVILGVWQAAAAAAIIAPRFPLIKEWAYVGCFFLWSGAVWSHLIVGAAPGLWGVPLAFGVCAVASWVLRPTDRRLPATQLRQHRGGAGASRSSPEGGRARRGRNTRGAWAVALGLFVAAFGFSFLTLPVVEPMMHDRAVELGWIDP